MFYFKDFVLKFLRIYDDGYTNYKKENIISK